MKKRIRLMMPVALTGVSTNAFIVTSRIRLESDQIVTEGLYSAGKIRKGVSNENKVLLIALFAVALLIAPVVCADTWSGWITDENCGAKGAKSGHKECALKCLGEGAALVFYNSADAKIYKLDNQEMAKEHAGAEVEVTGEFNGNLIKVTSIVDKSASD